MRGSLQILPLPKNSAVLPCSGAALLAFEVLYPRDINMSVENDAGCVYPMSTCAAYPISG